MQIDVKFLRIALLLALFGVLSSVSAFPPAPGVVVYGSVRNEFGWGVGEGQGTLIFSSGEQELKRVILDPGEGTNIGENFRVLLPLDMEGETDRYRPEVLAGGLPFQVHVEIAGQIYLPMEMFVGIQAPDEPASEVRLDFTLGKDQDADGLPDAWEYWQLESAGIGPDDPNYNLDQLDADGDADDDGVANRDEYNAGTYAFVFTNKFALLPKRVLEDDWLEFEFEGVLDKAYLFECSEDMNAWEPLEVAIWGNRESREISYRPPRTGKVAIHVPPPTETLKFFRVTVH